MVHTYSDISRNHTLQMAAALSYYFVLSLFPALIFLSAIVAYLPVPDLFGQAVNFMGRFVPPDSMGLIKKVLADVVTPNRGAFLSLGLLGTLWAASGGLSAAMEALNIAYDVEETRPFWKTRPLAIALTFLIGALLHARRIFPGYLPWFGRTCTGPWLWASLFSRSKLCISLHPTCGSDSSLRCREPCWQWAAGSACRTFWGSTSGSSLI